MAQLIKRLFYIFSILLISTGLYAQSLDQAKKLYNEGEYEEAKPVFERLVKQAPNNASYNQWYGVCCYETGDYENAEKYLLVAAKRKVQEASRYLGDLYFKTYRFDEAAEMYEEYARALTKKKQDAGFYEERASLAEKAHRMLDRVEDVQVIDSVIVNKNDFLSTYLLSEESGTVTPYRNFFQTGQREESTVYMNQKGDHIYYARQTGEGNYDLFSQSRLLDSWGDEKQLPNNINTGEDENYPFVLSDGVTIYYASKGNGSIGGYDLFVTRYNINSETYLTPEQLGMPYNSPANDYMIVFDEMKGLGWFVSDRYQPEDKVCLYLFIPNDNRTRFDSDDMDVKRERAALTSIQSTWKPGTDYSELVRLAYTEIKGEEDIRKDFEFVINNNTIYYTIEEIRSAEARNFYQKVVDLRKQIDDLNGKLDELRTTYSQSNNTRKEQLKPEILKTEEALEALLEQPEALERRARNAEINHLRNNR